MIFFKFKKKFLLDDKNNEYKHMNWNEFHRLDVIHSFLEELEFNYPSICTVGVIGSSLEGRDLKVYITKHIHNYIMLNQI